MTVEVVLVLVDVEVDELLEVDVLLEVEVDELVEVELDELLEVEVDVEDELELLVLEEVEVAVVVVGPGKVSRSQTVPGICRKQRASFQPRSEMENCC